MLTRTQKTFALLILACLSLIAAQPAHAGNSDFQISQHGEADIVANTIVAQAPAGTLPEVIKYGSYSLHQVDRISSFSSGNELVLYSIDNGRSAVNYAFVLQFLGVAVPEACVDLNIVYGSPNTWGTGSAYPIHVLGQTVAPEINGNGDLLTTPTLPSHWALSQIHHSTAHQANHSDNTYVAILDVFQNGTENYWPGTTLIPGSGLPPIATNSGLPDVSAHGDMIHGIISDLDPSARFLHVETMNAQGMAYTYSVVKSLDTTLKAFSTMKQPNQFVVNMSFGSDQPDKCGLLQALIDEARSKLNIVFVAAAGNEVSQSSGSLPPQYPAALNGVIAVSGSNKNGVQSSYANDGDLMAPAGEPHVNDVGLCSNPSTAVTSETYTSTGQMVTMVSCGTSFSAAYVSGLGSALFSYKVDANTIVEKDIDYGALQNNGIISVFYSFQ